jgi:hypothetical protein
MTDLEIICRDCQRTNWRNACTGFEHHCPLAVVDDLMEGERAMEESQRGVEL